MTQPPDWTIVFYIEDSGRRPVNEFLSELDDGSQKKILLAMERLRLLNTNAREPLIKHLVGKLYELRVERRANAFRFLYFFYIGRRIVFVHGFQKKTQKTPRGEINIAITRINRYVEREGS